MVTVLIISTIWLFSFVITAVIFANKGIPCTLANILLALTPVLNTIIVIKGVLFSGIFKEMKNTLKIIFINRKNKYIGGRI